MGGATVIAAVALASAALVAGCGDDGSAAAIQKLDAICRASNLKAASEIVRFYDDPRVKGARSESKAIALEVNLFAPIVLADAEAQARAIRNFDLPSGDKEQVDAILAAYGHWIERAKRAPRSTVLANDVYNEARALAGKYGLADCGMSPFAVKTTAGTTKATQTG